MGDEYQLRKDVELLYSFIYPITSKSPNVYTKKETEEFLRSVLGKEYYDISTIETKFGDVERKFDELIDLIYPVGSIYMSVNDISPSVVIGGEWEKIEGRFLLGSSVDYPLTVEVEGEEVQNTGGEATHTLTINEMPSHDHKIYRSGADTVGNKSFRQTDYTTTATDTTSSTGGGQPHNNMPPYMVVNIWKRTK